MKKNSKSTIVVDDGCAINAETVLGRFPVEPLNTFSNFGFLFIIVYWIWKTKFKIRLYPVIVITMPLLFGAFIAGTMHHALRNDKVWHHIDMLCIFYAVITTCVYLWYRVTEKWMKSFLCVIAVPLVFRLFLASIALPDKIAISVVFVVLGLTILIPATIHCIKNHLKNLDMLILSSISFIIALTFRQADADMVGFFPFGTHFLWHIFGMISLFYLVKYIFLTDKAKNLKFFKKIASQIK